MPMTQRDDARRAVAVAALIASVILTAGCSGGSGPGVASAGSSAQATRAASGTQKPSTLAYARCMIRHGIQDFPEPNAKGQIAVTNGQLPDINSPQFKAAMKACLSLDPAGTAAPVTNTPQHQAAEVRYATCMRSHGVPDFPDPQSNGTFDLGGINAGSPQVLAADKACASPGVGIFAGARTSP